MSEYLLLLIVIVEGFVTISAEVLAIRQLIPVAGNSVVVTSIIIGIFLLFLAYGYQRGGQYSKDFIRVLKANFTKSAIWLGVGLSYSVIHVFFHYSREILSDNVLVILTLYLLVFIAPLIYILGQTVPITMNLIKQKNTTGAVGGKILHVSTLGSFFGSVLTSLLLMNYLGVAWTVFINYLLLSLMMLLLLTKSRTDMWQAFILIVVGIFVYQLNIGREEELFIKANSFAHYKVVEQEGTKLLQLNGSNGSIITLDKKGYQYIETIKKILFQDLALTGKKILVLGAGGFTLSAENTYGNHFVYVDVDSDIKKIVEQHFLSSINGDFVAQDAREYLRTTTEKFDVIVSDVYSSRRFIPSHLLTVEYFDELKHHLSPSGIAVINVIGRPLLNDKYSERMDNTIRQAFHYCMSIPQSYGTEMTNILYVCHHQGERSLSRFDIYRDDLNQSTLDFFYLSYKQPGGLHEVLSPHQKSDRLSCKS